MVAQWDRDYLRIAGKRASARRIASYLFYEGRPATTRGQWVNPIVRVNLSWAMRRVNSVPLDAPIFILGVGRSGTTHLGRLLSVHPDVGWLNEPKLMWSLLVPDEDVSGFYSSHGRFRLTAADISDEMKVRFNRVGSTYLKSVRAKRLVDKYPEMTYRIPFIRALAPDAKILVLVRRPEDFVNSVVEWNRRKGGENADWWGVGRNKWTRMYKELVATNPDLHHLFPNASEPSEQEMAATEWVVGMSHILENHSDMTMIIRYEELAKHPSELIGRILDFCDLDYSAQVAEFARVTTSSHLRSSPANFGALQEAVESVRRRLWPTDEFPSA